MTPREILEVLQQINPEFRSCSIDTGFDESGDYVQYWAHTHTKAYLSDTTAEALIEQVRGIFQ